MPAPAADRFPDAREQASPHAGLLPVPEPLDELFPYGGLPRGSVVTVDSVTLALALIASPDAAGAWSGALGIPDLGLAAAQEAGIALSRFVLVPHPGEQWATAAAVLIDGLDVLLTTFPRGTGPAQARRLSARARERHTTVIALRGWPGSVDLRIQLLRGQWMGLDHGYGRLTGRRCQLVSSGRGAAARERRVTAWLPPGP
ncbi:MAG TPA: hypothetical protein VHC41_03480 [Mycobacteriales bacterium]|nr:hypothetical protein [Mycobacteriales bacterium]